jgi:hypothetical protein
MLAAFRVVTGTAVAWSSPRPDTDGVVRMLKEEMPALPVR